MDISSTLWLFPILFMVHNFEELIMIQPWWRHDRNQSIQSPFVKIATYPQETVAALIGSIFFLFSFITAYSILSHNLIIGIGLALAFGLQLVGHVAEFVRVRRRYMPYILTSVLTLPYYPWLLLQALHAGFGAGELVLATVGMGGFGLIVLRLSHAINVRVSRLLTA